MRILKTARNWLMLAATISSLFILSACGGGGNDNTTDYGELIIELTDAEGDFSNYSVDVLSITLTKEDDSIVEVLPETTRIDFAQYVEMSELLTSATVPSGIYKSATLTLDYSNAEIFAENADGDNIQATSIVDENNDTITTLKTKVTLDDRNRLRIAPGVPAHLSLDFDLKTSNVVSFDDPAAPVVTVSPVLNASLEPDLDKTHRVRGPLKTVDVDNNSFDLIIRPFNHRFKNKREHFGSLRINVDENTTFDINGEGSAGNDGLLAMDNLEQLTAVIVVGDITFNPKRFKATEVYAGTSVPGGDMDVVKGTVLSRADNTLVVKGATLIRTGGSVFFNDEVSITIDETTMVKRQLDENDYNISDISVGQKITIFGDLNDDTANPALDATQGMARLLVTAISGTVVLEKDDANSQLLAINLAHINGRKVELFNFEGTGIDAANDADPTSYEIETSTLSLNEFPLESTINIRGFVNSFAAAPADFIAKSINNKTYSAKAKMHTDWKPETNAAFSLISADKITLDLTGVGHFHHIGRGRHSIDLTSLSTDFSLVSAADDTTVRYVVQTRGSLHVHTTFENLSNDLTDLMAAGNKVRRIQAFGSYEPASGNFIATSIKIKMK